MELYGLNEEYCYLEDTCLCSLEKNIDNIAIILQYCTVTMYFSEKLWEKKAGTQNDNC